ncbi:MAG: sensor protein KdpD [Sporocytophaga sp.]|uniref:sensor protein KdpD n=1 Tax=Sporocytophaga sp. TaxID=2231183 RepID=UPI001B0C1C6F|nr:sensor protein KdpD [Sporocytophaga sp.]MBO9703346.1 sensor protein KdpD [Sporocytophaga sp.]
MSEQSASAERFLNLIQHSKRGKFKIYIGMSAGVGKSYRMLQEAHQLLKNNVDVWIGYIETHKRSETEALTTGLPVIPRKEIFYKGHRLEEMDIDAIILKRPELVIVDELAHTNVPGSKYEKRWQDVEEILNAGINVISALNIQHIESINSEVSKITGVEVQERVPDRIIRMADEVVNIDLTIDELIERLMQGKIYVPEKIQTALTNFFKKDNLLQLRELALKEVTHQVERKVDKEVFPQSKLSDNILGCISENYKVSQKVIRKTARYAGRFQAEWYILYVETPKSSMQSVDLATQRHLINNFQLVTELGGTLQRLKGTNVSDEIVKFSGDHNVSVIIAGRSRASWYTKVFKADVISRLQQKLKNTSIDLTIVS